MTVTLEQADVIVVGSGFAGLAAAVEAAEAGCSVVVLEKMIAFGGNSAISDGGIAAPGIDYQVAAGISDSPDLMYEDLLKAGEGLNYPKQVEVKNRLEEKGLSDFQPIITMGSSIYGV